MEYLRHPQLSSHDPNFGAGFVRPRGDETDAMVVCFGLLGLARMMGGHGAVFDPDNPIRKHRQPGQAGVRGRGSQKIDQVTVAGPIPNPLPGATVTRYPLHYRGEPQPGPETAPGRWSSSTPGKHESAPGFLEAEAEPTRISRGLQAIG